MKKKFDYFRLITIPKILWTCGGGLIDYIRSWWHLRVMKRGPIWEDADSESCKLLICRFCGRDKLWW